MDQRIESQAVPSAAAGRARGGRPTQQDELVCLHDPATDVRLLVRADGMGARLCQWPGNSASASRLRKATNAINATKILVLNLTIVLVPQGNFKMALDFIPSSSRLL